MSKKQKKRLEPRKKMVSESVDLLPGITMAIHGPHFSLWAGEVFPAGMQLTLDFSNLLNAKRVKGEAARQDIGAISYSIPKKDAVKLARKILKVMEE